MAAKQMSKTPPPHAIDDDSISLTSSRSAEYASDQEFEVDAILAEKPREDRFLILWKDYPEEKATWEPRRNIRHPDVVSAWKKRKEQEAKGEKPPFDVAAYNAKLEGIARARTYRHRLRKNKRKRLGIPVSPSPSDSEPPEIHQVEDSPENYFETKEPSKATLRKTNKPAQVPKPPLTEERIVISSDDDTDCSRLAGESYVSDNKKARKKPIEAIKDKNPARTSPVMEDRTPTPALGKNQSTTPKLREALESSPDLPTSNQRPLSRNGSTSSVSSHPVSPTDPQTRRPSLTNRGLSAEKQSTGSSPMSPMNPQASRPCLTTSSSLSEKPSSGGRGQVVKRGSSTGFQNINIFTGGKTRKTKASLIEQAADPTKKEKHFSNMHLQYKAQIQSRNKADAAPDPKVVGGLFEPSKITSLPAMRPSTLRRNSSSNVVPQALDDQVEAPLDISPVSPKSNTATIESGAHVDNSNLEPQRPAWTEEDGSHSICYFWYNTGCKNGGNCQYYHSDDITLPIAPKPGTKASRSYTSDMDLPVTQGSYGNNSEHLRPHSDTVAETIVSETRDTNTAELRRPSWTEKEPYNAICFFWRTRGHCYKGAACDFLHIDNPDLPLAPDPSKRTEACTFFLAGNCSKGDHCRFAHPREHASNSVEEARNYGVKSGIMASAGVIPEEPQTSNGLRASNLFVADKPIPISQEQEQLVPPGPRRTVSFSLDGQMSVPGELQTRPSGPRKSVSFAEDERNSITDETRRTTPMGLANAPRMMREKVCPHWLRGDCHHGSLCWYKHYISDRPLENLVDRGENGSDYEVLSTRQREPGMSSGEIEIYPISEFEKLHSQYPTKPPNFSEDMQPLDTTSLHETDILNPSSTASIAATTAATKSKRKVTMDDYRRQKAFKTLGTTAKEVVFGSERSESIVLDFGNIDQAFEQPWAQPFNALSKLQFDQMCTAQDLKAQRASILRQIFWRGSILSNTADQSVLMMLNDISQQLRLSSGGLISTSGNSAVLMYPPGDEWNFIDEPPQPISSGALRYLIFGRTFESDGEIPPSVAESPSDYRRTLVKSIHELSFRKLVPKPVKEKAYHIYMFFPPSANDTSRFITSWLSAAYSRRLCKIYTSQTEGSWEYFVHNSSIEFGTVLIHESVVTAISELPALHKVIAGAQNRSNNFWYIGDSSSPYPLFSPPRGSTLGQITATRLLPHGQAILLTPSFIVAEPERACQFIEWFHKRSKISTRGTYKLVCCTNISDYLLDLAVEKSRERDDFEKKHKDVPTKDFLAEQAGLSWKTSGVRFSVHKYMLELLLKDTADDSSSFYDSDISDEATCPVVYADETIDPDDEQALVNWFAGWTMTKLDQFRKFTVVGTSGASKARASRIKEVAIETQPPYDHIQRSKSKEYSERSYSAEHSLADNLNQATEAKSSTPVAAISFSESSNLEPFRNRKDPPPGGSPFIPSAFANLDGANDPEEPEQIDEHSGRITMNQDPAVVAKKKFEQMHKEHVAARLKQADGPFDSTTGSVRSGDSDEMDAIRSNTLDRGLKPFGNIENGMELKAYHDFHPQSKKGIHLGVQEGDQIQIIKHVSGVMHYGLNMRTQQRGQVAEWVFHAPSDLTPEARVIHNASQYKLDTDIPFSRSPDYVYSPQLDQASQFGPSQFDGPSDGRPQSSSSSRSGIGYDEKGSRFVPRSVRPSGTERPERPVRPGFVPKDDDAKYEVGQNRRIVNGLPQDNGKTVSSASRTLHKDHGRTGISLITGQAYTVDSTGRKQPNKKPSYRTDGSSYGPFAGMDNRNKDFPAVGSPSGSKNHSRRYSDTNMAMQSHTPESTAQSPLLETSNMRGFELRNAIIDGFGDRGENAQRYNVNKKETRFEPTTEWYAKLKAEGKGWEHIYVDSWDRCFKHVGVGK